ncbi:hypothetical protein [Sporanaerobacter sp. PP17-6a]|uniref:hypothetical protein n=1 Tax=Sporanaerobacter sp. PP17-6a TaxID=1891289 RepID=UPI0008A06CE4|nr:hypothetical protein [Sporanaerobacter sp. PP17-6a]SCL95623.1 YceG-like family protein [Sporanaerobacter sp. PP17-6a]
MTKKIYFFYILIGIGIGIIFSTFIFKLNPIVEDRQYSDDEIIEKAKELGMVFVKENIDVKPSSKEEYSSFVVKNGDTLIDISNNLFKKGFVDDPDEFTQFVKDKGLERKIAPEKYELKKNLSYTTILKILTEKE